MKWLLVIILPWFLTACVSISHTHAIQTPELVWIDSTEMTVMSPKILMMTREADTKTMSAPENTAKITVIMATKNAGTAKTASTMTAQPTETPVPTIPLTHHSTVRLT